METSTEQSGALLQNLLLFGRLLHALGLEANPGRMLDVVPALPLISIGRKQDFHHTLRSFLVKRQEDIALFDQAFELFWRKPPDGSWEIDLDQLLALQAQQRATEEKVVIPPRPEKSEDVVAEPEADEVRQEVIELTQTFSEREVLRTKDFGELTPQEFAAIKQLMEKLVWQMGQRRTRRQNPGREGVIDIRRSFRRNLRHGGELLLWSHRTPKVKPRPLILIADISGSMEQYSRVLLQFLYAMTHGTDKRLEVFLFGTRLTRITRQLRVKDVDQALRAATNAVADWSGGTRIGDALKAFNYDWGRRVLRNGPIVILISDGWDRGDPELLGREMGRLNHFCYRLIWLNPLLGSDRYQPLTRGMQAALPYIDDFLPVHNFASLEGLAAHLNGLDGKRTVKRHRLPIRGAAFVRT